MITIYFEDGTVQGINPSEKFEGDVRSLVDAIASGRPYITFKDSNKQFKNKRRR
jgi:hypothetical protein